RASPSTKGAAAVWKALMGSRGSSWILAGEEQADVRGHHPTVGMHVGAPAARQLTVAGAPGELPESLDGMRHAAGDAAVAEGKQATMGVERQRAVERIVAMAQARSRSAARRESGLLEQYRQGDRERIVDLDEIDRVRSEAG